MDLVFIHGKMEEFMKETTKMIKNMALVFIPGQMEGDIKDTGPEANSMDLECIPYHNHIPNLASGKKENV
jgi:hypothetical protein